MSVRSGWGEPLDSTGSNVMPRFHMASVWQPTWGNLQLSAGYFWCRSIVGPPSETNFWMQHGTRWSLHWRNRPWVLLHMPTPPHGLTPRAKIFWNLARHVATLCAHGWVRRLLSWHGPSTTYMGVTASGVSQACGSRILLDDMLHKGKFGTIPRIGSLGGDSTNLSALEAAIQYGF